jgi:hypothetical protein
LAPKGVGTSNAKALGLLVDDEKDAKKRNENAKTWDLWKSVGINGDVGC